MRPVTAREQDQPLCPEGDFRFWASVGATATAAWVLGCLAGLAPLVGHPAGSPSLIERLSAAAAAAVADQLVELLGVPVTAAEAQVEAYQSSVQHERTSADLPETHLESLIGT